MSLEANAQPRVEVAVVDAAPDHNAVYEQLENVLLLMGCGLAAVLISAIWVALALG